MGSFTREIITASSTYTEDSILSEMLADFAEALFKEGLIQFSPRYDKETGEIIKELSIEIVKKAEK